MGTAENMQEVLQVRPGEVSPLAACGSKAARVILLLDESLKSAPFLIHPMDGGKTVRITAAQLDQYLSTRGKAGHWVDLSKTDLAPGPAMSDLKQIADTVAEEKVKGEVKLVPKGAANKKGAKCVSSPNLRLPVLLWVHRRSGLA
jgi:hypothetical protein